MKKIVSLILAVVSTMFLVAGVARAAALFDPIAPAVKTTHVPGTIMDDPTNPCNYAVASGDQPN